MWASGDGGTARWVRSFIRSRSRDDAALDTTRIMVLRQSLGDQRCREIVSEVVFHLTDRLGLLQTALAAGDGAEAQVLASRLASLSEQVGPRRLRPGGPRPRGLPHRRRRHRHRRGRGAADAARRGFALLGHPLRRSIGLVADPAGRVESPPGSRSRYPEHAAGRRARPPGGSASPDRFRRPAGLAGRPGRADAGLGRGHGVRGRRRRGPLPAGAGRRGAGGAGRLGHRRPPGGATASRSRRPPPSCRPGATRSFPRASRSTPRWRRWAGSSPTIASAATAPQSRRGRARLPRRRRRRAGGADRRLRRRWRRISINTPARDMGPEALEAAFVALGGRHGAEVAGDARQRGAARRPTCR